MNINEAERTTLASALSNFLGYHHGSSSASMCTPTQAQSLLRKLEMASDPHPLLFVSGGLVQNADECGVDMLDFDSLSSGDPADDHAYWKQLSKQAQDHLRRYWPEIVARVEKEIP